MSRYLDHEELIRRGLNRHEARRYADALGYFNRALAQTPGCPLAEYNKANSLHMLGLDAEAEPLLRRLMAATDADLRTACPVARPRSLRLDAAYLLFLALVHGQGFSAEAFGFADLHLRLRGRGVLSVWSAREVRAEVAAFRCEWQSSTLNKALPQTAGA